MYDVRLKMQRVIYSILSCSTTLDYVGGSLRNRNTLVYKYEM